MPANQVMPPFPTFNDQDGYPLNGGYLYIGQPGFEAQSTPKPSFFDIGLTIPTGTASGAAVRLNNGYAVYNGSPSLVYSDGPCSLTVKDANQVLIFSTLNFDPRIALGLPSQGFPVDVIYQANFDTRAAFVVAVAGGYTAPTGYTVHAGGLAFVKVASGGLTDIPGWASARRNIVGDINIDVPDTLGIQSNDIDGLDKFQTLLDTAPIGAVLNIPSQFIIAGSTSLTMSRAMQIKMHGNGSALRLDTTNPGLSVLKIAITDAGGGDTAVRGVTLIEGGKVFTNGTGGFCAVNVNPNNTLPNQKPIFTSDFKNVGFGGRQAGLRIGGANALNDTNFNRAHGCSFESYDAGTFALNLANCADGHAFYDCLFFGNGYGARIDVTNGAFVTRFIGCNMQGKSGGILAANGDKVILDGVTFERKDAGNAGPYRHITMQGLARPHKWWTVQNCNFGGGDFVNANLFMVNSEQCFFQGNTFNITAGGVDIALGAGASYNIFGTNMRRGAGGSGLAAPTDLGRRLAVTIDAAALGNEGIWYPAARATLSNGWTSGAGVAAFEFMKNAGMLGFHGNLSPGTLAAGTEMVQLPTGFAARNSTFTTHVNDATSLPALSVFHTTAGKLQVGAAVAGRPYYMSGTTVPDAGLPSGYNTGP